MTVDDYTTENSEAVTVGKKSNLFKWYMVSNRLTSFKNTQNAKLTPSRAAETFLVDWSDSTLLDIYENGTDTSFTTDQHVIQLDNANEWVYVSVFPFLILPFIWVARSSSE